MIIYCVKNCASAQLSILKAQKRVVNVKAQKDWILRE